MDSRTRRRLLRALGAGAGAATVGGLSGCLQPPTGGCGESTPTPVGSLPDEPGPLDVAADWPMVHRDAANTASVRPAGPAGDVVRRWQADVDLGDAGETWVVAVGDRAYVTGRGGGAVAALDATDGSTAWRQPDFRDTGPLAVASGAGLVLVPGADGLAALTAANGEVAWRTDGPALGGADAVLVDDGTAYVAGAGQVLAVDVASGDVRWSVAGGGPLAVADDRVIAGDGVRALNAADGSERWAAGEEAPDRAVSVGTEAAYFGGRGRVTALALSDGSPTWRFEGGQEAFGVPAVVQGRLVVGTTTTEEGGGSVYAATREDGERRWCSRLAVDDVNTAVGDGVAYAAAGPILAARRVNDGQPVWLHRDDDRRYRHSAVAEGALLAGAEDGQVDAFGER